MASAACSPCLQPAESSWYRRLRSMASASRSSSAPISTRAAFSSLRFKRRYGGLRGDRHAEFHLLLPVRRRDIEQLQAVFLQALRLQRFHRELGFDALACVLARIEPLLAAVGVRHFQRRLGALVLERDR